MVHITEHQYVIRQLSVLTIKQGHLTMTQYTIKSAKPATGWIVTDSQGTPHQFAKLWLALSWIEKQLKG